MVRSLPESEWDELQQSWMLALSLWRSQHCQGCGGDLEETTIHETWDVPPPLRCHRCTAIAVHQEQHAKDHKHTHALRWAAYRRG